MPSPEGMITMETWVWIVIAIVVIAIVVAAIIWSQRRTANRTHERMERAQELRAQGQEADLRAKEEAAEAARRQADAQRARMEAERLERDAQERAAEAERAQQTAREHLDEAHRLHPEGVDADGRDVGRRVAGPDDGRVVDADPGYDRQPGAGEDRNRL